MRHKNSYPRQSLLHTSDQYPLSVSFEIDPQAETTTVAIIAKDEDTARQALAGHVRSGNGYYVNMPLQLARSMLAEAQKPGNSVITSEVQQTPTPPEAIA
jgi:hypothetical protein